MLIKVKNGTEETLRIPPVEEIRMFIEFRDADGEMIYQQPIYDRSSTCVPRRRGRDGNFNGMGPRIWTPCSSGALS